MKQNNQNKKKQNNNKKNSAHNWIRFELVSEFPGSIYIKISEICSIVRSDNDDTWFKISLKNGLTYTVCSSLDTILSLVDCDKKTNYFSN